MIKFRKILTVAAAVLSVLALLSSCGEEKPQSGSLPDSNFTGYYPDFLNPEYGDGYVVSDDITAKTDSEKYRVSDDTIVVTLTSATPNLPIWCFRHPALEKKNGDKWELLPMSEKVFNDAFYDTGWRGYMKEWGSEDQCMTQDLKLKKSDMYREWGPGEYRAVVFLGANNVAYAEFQITDR